MFWASFTTLALLYVAAVVLMYSRPYKYDPVLGEGLQIGRLEAFQILTGVGSLASAELIDLRLVDFMYYVDLESYYIQMESYNRYIAKAIAKISIVFLFWIVVISLFLQYAVNRINQMISKKKPNKTIGGNA